jgi:hypothetical protein
MSAVGHTAAAVPIIHEVDIASPRAAAPYAFENAFTPDHFVWQWIDFFSDQCDAAYEFFEATALLALSMATHAMSVHLSGAADPLRTNLYLAFVGDTTTSRKSTAKDFLVKVARAIPNLCTVLPEMASRRHRRGLVGSLGQGRAVEHR